MNKERLLEIRKAIETKKFRSSMAGSVVSASGKLIQTGKSYGDSLILEIRDGYKKSIDHVKSIKKGVILEAEARGLVRRVLFGNKTYIADSQREVESEYYRGHIDMETDRFIIDTKVSEDVRTFEESKLTWDNEWQMKSYLYSDFLSTGKLKTGYVVKCLLDLPEELILKEESKIYRYGGYTSADDPDYIEECAQFRANNIYPHREDKDRIMPFKVELLDSDIEKLNKQARELKEYMLETFDEWVAKRESFVGLLA